jgi:hypothetical protein
MSADPVVTAEPASKEALERKPRQPTFDLYANHLCCPRCNGECLHHGAVTIFDRKEDAKEVMIIEVENLIAKSYVADNINSFNPSSRRNAVTVQFWCEECDGYSEFCITQHKGTSFFGWRPSIHRKGAR